MSTSPTRYYASRPSSRSTSRPTSPPSAAEVRSQAVAKLKRAASLPRTPAGRRPSTRQAVHDDAQGSQDTAPLTTDLDQPGPSTYQHSPAGQDTQEMLSPSPINSSFDHNAIYTHAQALQMQRSASASSSFHMPTPPHLAMAQGAPYFAASPSPVATPDWAAMQLAQSYLPSLSPVPVGGSPFIAGLTAVPGQGRNTPSPLPTLGELRTLQRSNSNAARAHAMSKLTGGRDTPSDEDHSSRPLERPGLQRADSLGAPRPLGMSLTRLAPPAPKEAESLAPPTSFAEPRPRLQRSFTVSSSNMGEERRSAVGRRMVERLAERRAAREKEEAEVRRLWEESRGTASEGQHRSQDEDEVAVESDSDTGENHAEVPTFERTSPVEPAPTHLLPVAGEDMLGIAPRSLSRSTQHSTDEAFEYEAHLRRSLSSRTARNAMGTVTEAVPPLQTQPEEVESMTASNVLHSSNDEEALEPPRPAFATPIRHTPQPSSSTTDTAGSQSPSGASTMSRETLGSMMFIMGGRSSTANAAGPREGSWPVGVEENGSSDWGTPGKEMSLPPAFAESPPAQSPLTDKPMEPPSISPISASDPDLTPPAQSRRTSVMSWEEVGGEADREVPSDTRYHKKSGSISAKLGRTVKAKMRKRSQSRGSATSSITSPPTSPRLLGDRLSAAAQSFSRRGSESSVSPSQASAGGMRSLTKGSPMIPQGEQIHHQPSVSSLSPSTSGPAESSANSLLLQHQLSTPTTSTGFLPRPDPNDPRILSSKLSPFPGIVNLEGGHRLADPPAIPEAPKLVHQNSDSQVPSQQRVIPAVADNIYSLPLPASTDDRRVSGDSASKRSWLAKAFGQATSPRSSGSTSRKSSKSDLNISPVRRQSADTQPSTTAPDHDPFAAPPPPSGKSRPRVASPTVSVVPELSEEGSRLTRFTTHRDMGPMHVPEPRLESGGQLPSQSVDVLQRMDNLLALAPDDPARPDILDDPPRKLLLATQVLQVVNVHTAKDRYLFLFNDILVITKPLITSGINATLDMKFVVKSVVSLDKLHVHGFAEESTSVPERSAVIAEFIERFARDPHTACRILVERNRWKDDAANLASVIFKTAELDKTQIGVLLSENEPLMRAFIDLFHFTGVRIDDALRMFLLSLRLPGDPIAAERLLRGLAYRYSDANKGIVSFDRDLAAEVVLSIMQLDDSLHGGQFGFALRNPALRPDIFILAFRSKDSEGLVDDDLLSDIYASIKHSPLSQALAANQADQARQISVLPAKLPTRLTYNTWSDPITICIAEPDPHFQIELLGDGMEFDPPRLDFHVRNTATFRVRGRVLGTRSILFDRVGENAKLYAGLGNARVFNVERAFMKHTFQVSFSNHLGFKRKYCFSVTERSVLAKWAATLPRQIMLARQATAIVPSTPEQRVRAAAEAVALQVLRDALIPPVQEERATERDRDRDREREWERDREKLDGRPRLERSGSVSIAYAEVAGKDEKDLGPLIANKPGNATDRTGGMMECQTGKELVLVCRQNSLLPGMLELLRAGVHRGG